MSEQLTIGELIDIIARAWKLTLASTLIGAFIALATAYMSPDIYRSSALLAPSESQQSGGASLLRQYGAIASLAGVSMPSAEVSKAKVALEVLQSRSFLVQFAKRHEILNELFGAAHWENSTKTAVFDHDIIDIEKMVLYSPPDDHAIYTRLRGAISIAESQDTGLVTVAVEHVFPETARLWVSLLVSDLNEVIKSKDALEATQSINYLQEQAASTLITDLDMVFYELIQNQMQTLVLAQVRQEYVFTTIDPPVTTFKKVRPNRSLMIGIGAILGALTGLLLAIFPSLFNKR